MLFLARFRKFLARGSYVPIQLARVPSLPTMFLKLHPDEVGVYGTLIPPIQHIRMTGERKASQWFFKVCGWYGASFGKKHSKRDASLQHFDSFR